MKILIIGCGYPTKKYPMNGIFSFDQARILSEKHSVIYGFLDMRSILRKRKLGFEIKNIDGIKVIGLSIPIGRIPKKIFIHLQNFFMFFLLKRISLNEKDIKVVHSHFFDMSHSVLKNKSLIKAKYGLTEHASSMNNSIITKIDKEIANFAYSNSDFNLAVSNPLKESLFYHFKIKFDVLENVYDYKLFKFDEEAYKNDKFTFVSIGSLEKRKGMDLTIGYFYDAFGVNSEIKLLIIGDGPEKEKLQLLINSLNLQNSIEILGPKSRQDISNILKMSHAFILLSRLETFGVVYLEALACGIPVIATKCGGPEDFVNRYNGYLINQNKIDEVPEILKKMINDYNTFNQKTISIDILNRFGPKAFLSKINKYY